MLMMMAKQLFLVAMLVLVVSVFIDDETEGGGLSC